MSRKKILGLLLVLLLLLLPMLPFTPPGTRLLIATLNKLTPLDIGYLEGSLAGKLKLSTLRLELANLDIQLQGLELELNLGCLFYSRLCLDTLVLERLLVDISEGDPDDAEADAVGRELIKIPFDLAAPGFTIRNTLVSWTDGGWSNGKLEGGVTVSGSQITLTDIKAAEAFLRLATAVAPSLEHTTIIELPQLHLPLELVVDNLLLEHPRWSFDELNHQHVFLRLDGRWERSQLEIQSVSLASEDWGELSLEGSLSLLGSWSILVEGEAALDKPPLWSGLHDRIVGLGVSGTLDDLQLTLLAPGPQSYQLNGSVNSLDKGAPFELQMEASWPEPLRLADVPDLEGELPEIQLNSPWVLSASGSIADQIFSLQGAASGYGYADLELLLEGQQENFSVAVDSLVLSDVASDSAMDVSGLISFEDALRWDLNIGSGGVSLPVVVGGSPGRLQGALVTRGEVSADQWRVEIESEAIQGEINNTPASFSGTAMLNSQLLLSNSDFKVLAKGARLSVVALGDTAPQLELAVDDVSHWLTDGQGSLNLSAQLQDSQRKLVFSGQGDGLSWQGASIPRGQIRGHYDFGETRDLDLLVTLEQIQYQNWNAKDVRLAAAGDEKALSFTLSSQGDVETRLEVAGEFDRQSWSGILQPTSLGTPSGVWQLDSPVALRWDTAANSLGVAAHCWHQQTSSICPGAMVLAEQGSASLKAAGDLRLFAHLVPAGTRLKGSLDAALNARWGHVAGLEAEASATLSNVTLSRMTGEDEWATTGWDEGLVSAAISGAGIRVNGEIWRNQTKQLQLNLQLPAEKAQSLEGSLDLEKFSLSGILKPFFPVFSDHSGTVDGKFSLSGTVDKPQLNGEVRLTEGRFSLVGNPTVFEQLNLSIKGAGDRADILGEMLVGNGATTIAGSLFFLPEPRLDVSIIGESQTLLLPPGLEATVSENLNLVAGSERLELTGDITVHEAVLEQEQLPVGSVDVSSDVVEVDYAGEVIVDQGPLDFMADIRINIQDSFRVVGGGLTTQVGGELNLKKAPTKPLQLFGQLNIIDGELNAFGQRLTIQRGSLSFVGEPDNPDLNLRAERLIDEDKVKVGVEVLGPLDSFSFDVYSTPAMSDEEKMSYLIRGRSLDKGAQADGAAVALSLGLGAVNSSGFVEELNNIRGISDVSFGSDGSAENTTATVSGYLGERIYIAYGVGVYEPINVLTTRFYLQAQLWLEVVSSLESSADIYYSFDIK